jgi:hypothetical protein
VYLGVLSVVFQRMCVTVEDEHASGSTDPLTRNRMPKDLNS